jgi:DNA-binding response OmpR family regulator
MGGKKTILVVEDDPQLRRMLTKHLELQHSVHAVENGELALGWLNDNPAPDLVCLDLALPTMSGFRVCESLRAQQKTRTVPVLVITARTSVQDHTFALEVGADAFLEKPFKFKELEAQIARLLGPAA